MPSKKKKPGRPRSKAPRKVPIQARVSPEMWRQWEAMALRNRRTKAQELIIAMEERLKSQAPPGTST